MHGSPRIPCTVHTTQAAALCVCVCVRACVPQVILHTNLPAQLASRVRSYTEFYYSKQSVYDVEQVLQHLTPALEREVKEFFLSQSVDGIPQSQPHRAHSSQCTPRTVHR